METIDVALSLMREALTLLDEPLSAPVAHLLRAAIDAAEQVDICLADPETGRPDLDPD